MTSESIVAIVLAVGLVIVLGADALQLPQLLGAGPSAPRSEAWNNLLAALLGALSAYIAKAVSK